VSTNQRPPALSDYGKRALAKSRRSSTGQAAVEDPYADVPPPENEWWPEEPGTADGSPVPGTDSEPGKVPCPARLSTIRLSDVQPERVSWLWPGRIPAGKLVTLDGDPSLGKSTLSLAFAAIVTTGGTWPDNSPCNFPGDVILLSAEDGLADTVRPRLDAAGADVTRVHAVQGVTLPDGTLRPPTLADVDELHRLVTETGARLLVVDVLMAYLPSGTDSHKDQDIRRVLSRLSALADATGCTVLLLRHLNKAKGGDPMYRGGGSIGIVGAVRAGMLVAKDPDDEDLRVLACTKSNLARDPGALTYRLTDADALGVARVEWIGTSNHDARALLADRGDDDDEPGGNPAAAFIFDYLMRDNVGGEAPAGDVLKAGKAAGFSDNDLKHARSRARRPRIASRKAGMGGGWVWAIDTEGATKVPKVPASQSPEPSAPSVAPSGVGRAVVTVSHEPDGWATTDDNKVCNTVLSRRLANRPACTAPVVWKVTSRKNHMIDTSHWCDADLPDNYRPQETTMDINRRTTP